MRESSSWCCFLFVFVQQRGERDSQNQAVLTKLKCAAGKTMLQPDIITRFERSCLLQVWINMNWVLQWYEVQWLLLCMCSLQVLTCLLVFQAWQSWPLANTNQLPSASCRPPLTTVTVQRWVDVSQCLSFCSISTFMLVRKQINGNNAKNLFRYIITKRHIFQRQQSALTVQCTLLPLK